MGQGSWRCVPVSYVVVTFGSSAPGWCDLSHCPDRVYGPFATSEEADEFMVGLPGWQQPHKLVLEAVS